MRLVSRLRRRLRDENGDRQRGAALVEFVLIAPVLVLITAAIFEYGLAFRDSMTLSNSLRSGARVGSNAGRERQADYTILKSVEAAMTEVPNSHIVRLIVYKATTADSAVPATCLAVPGSGGVNGALQRLPGLGPGSPPVGLRGHHLLLGHRAGPLLVPDHTPEQPGPRRRLPRCLDGDPVHVRDPRAPGHRHHDPGPGRDAPRAEADLMAPPRIAPAGPPTCR